MVKCILQPSAPIDEMFYEAPTVSTPHVEKMVLDGGESFALKAAAALEALVAAQGPPPVACAERPEDVDED